MFHSLSEIAQQWNLIFRHFGEEYMRAIGRMSKFLDCICVNKESLHIIASAVNRDDNAIRKNQALFADA